MFYDRGAAERAREGGREGGRISLSSRFPSAKARRGRIRGKGLFYLSFLPLERMVASFIATLSGVASDGYQMDKFVK